jgi:DNA-binding transcriptional MerR regulator
VAYAGLLNDIRENGVKTNLQFIGDSWSDAELLDGRNRLKALLELGLSWKTYAELLTNEDILDPGKHVLSMNQHRRHLTQSQLAMVAARYANLQNGTNQHQAKVGASTGLPTLGEVIIS